VAQGAELASAWALEMAPGARLELACRQTYESLLLRSRGYGMSKAVMDAVAHEEGLNLTALVRRLGRTPGAVRDYLQWLVTQAPLYGEVIERVVDVDRPEDVALAEALAKSEPAP